MDRFTQRGLVHVRVAFLTQGASVLKTRKLCLIGFINRDPGIMRPFRASIFLKAVQDNGPIKQTRIPHFTSTQQHLLLLLSPLKKFVNFISLHKSVTNFF